MNLELSHTLIILSALIEVGPNEGYLSPNFATPRKDIQNPFLFLCGLHSLNEPGKTGKRSLKQAA